MCGRYSSEGTNTSILAERFDAQAKLEAYEASNNIKPTHEAPVVIKDGGANALVGMQWGLIPAWAKDQRIGSKLFNARAETVHEKPSFRNAFKRRRCLVPATGFYEWRAENGGKKPYLFTVGDRELFAFAGLYEMSKTPDGQELYSYTIITTAPNELVCDVHDRMPVILMPDVEALWLDPDIADPLLLQSLLTAYPADEMRMQRYGGKL